MLHCPSATVRSDNHLYVIVHSVFYLVWGTFRRLAPYANKSDVQRVSLARRFANIFVRSRWPKTMSPSGARGNYLRELSGGPADFPASRRVRSRRRTRRRAMATVTQSHFAMVR